MHQRLKEFERESGLEIFGLGARPEYWDAATAKFAELIIRDCDQYARSTWEHGELLGGDLKRLFDIDQ